MLIEMDPARQKYGEVLKLIALYKAQPCLWDTNLDESKNANSRKAALDAIADRLNVSTEDVRKKLHNLRSQYRRENLRMRRLKTNRPKWLYFNALNFLRTTIRSKQQSVDPLGSFGDIKKPPSDDSDLECEQCLINKKLSVLGENTKFKRNNFNEISSRLTHSIANNQQTETEAFAEERSKLSLNNNKKSNRVLVIPSQTEQRDEYTVFGENVANELRSLENNKSLQHALKCTILQAILDINKVAYVNAPIPVSYEFEEAHLEEY